MKTPAFSLLMGLALLLNTWTIGFAAEKDDAIFFQNSDGPRGKFIWTTTKQQMMNSPKWSGIPERPPLSMDDAYKIAQTWYLGQGVKQLKLTGIALVKHPKLEDRWYYRLNFDPNADKALTQAYELTTLVILMDKTVIGAIPKPPETSANP